MKIETMIKVSLTKGNCLRIVAMLITMLSVLSVTQGQNEVSTAGGDGTGTGGTTAFTIGQVAYTNVHDEDGTINLGVQQPNLFLTVGVEETQITFNASVFPNPASDQASLLLDGKDFASWGEGLTYRLYDMDGKLLEQKPIESVITSIPMHHLSGELYVLQITRNNVEIKSFKIFKAN
jgi:hypothetical protein